MSAPPEGYADAPAVAPHPEAAWLANPMARLLVASAASLFLELACIRWAGGHVLYLSYVSNLLLLSCFFGLGVGCMSVALRPSLPRWISALIPPLLLAFAAAVSLGGVQVLVDGPQAVYYSNERAGTALPAWLVLPTLGSLAGALFAAIGTVIGRELAARPALTAYSFDIAGGLLGVGLFTLMSFLSAPASAWFAVAGVLLVPLLPRRAPHVALGVACVLSVVGLVRYADAQSDWSPYYRIRVHAVGRDAARTPGDPTEGSPSYRLQVNSITHQHIRDIRRREPFYEFAYHAIGLSPSGYPEGTYLVDPNARPLADPPATRWGGRVLVVGAGTGTDVAFALAYGASHVDAVEIDPSIASIGAALHPSRPYQDSRVHMHIDDGRAFLERATGTYDVVVYALPDSLTLASPYAGLRLESFLLTADSFRRAQRLVKPGTGILVLYNYYRERWLAHRTAATVSRAFGDDVRALLGNDRNLAAVFLAGPALRNAPLALGTEWGFRILRPPYTHPTVATDDWPFPYLRTRTVPTHLVWSMALLLAFTSATLALVVRAARGSGALAGSVSPRALAPYFFMGAAFLLLETAGLVRMARLFGTTWLVNSMVFFAVLAMVLAGNGLTPRLGGVKPAVLYGALLLALAGAFFLSPEALANAGPLLRYGAASVALFLPILLGNLAFSAAFRGAKAPALSLGANLLGAVVGGAVENLSLLLGYRALIVIAGAFYVAAYLTRPAPAADAPPSTPS